MNSAMVRDAADALSTADVALCVVDAPRSAGQGRGVPARAPRRAARPAILALNKIDMVAKPSLLPLIAEFSAPVHAFRDDRADLGGDGGRRRAARGRARREPCRKGSAAYPDDFLTRDAGDGMDRGGDPGEAPRAHPRGAAVRLGRRRRGRSARTTSKNLTVVTAVDRRGERGPEGDRRRKGRHDDPRHRPARRARSSRRESGRRFFLELTVRVRADWRDDERFLSRWSRSRRRGRSSRRRSGVGLPAGTSKVEAAARAPAPLPGSSPTARRAIPRSDSRSRSNLSREVAPRRAALAVGLQERRDLGPDVLGLAASLPGLLVESSCRSSSLRMSSASRRLWLVLSRSSRLERSAPGRRGSRPAG